MSGLVFQRRLDIDLSEGAKALRLLGLLHGGNSLLVGKVDSDATGVIHKVPFRQTSTQAHRVVCAAVRALVDHGVLVKKRMTSAPSR